MQRSRSYRVHAIVLTQDRPAELFRCVSEVARALNGEDAITVLDSSRPHDQSANAEVLARTRSASGPGLHVLRWQGVSGAFGSECEPWMAPTYRRDIAPLRNLSLLLAAVVESESTMLLDDDVRSVPVINMHRELQERSRAAHGSVLGAAIDGVSESDVLTRLEVAAGVLEERAGAVDPLDAKELFQVSARHKASTGYRRWYASGGCMAHVLQADQMTAFPPGYNEDWLWCELQDEQLIGQSERHRADHDPPAVRCPSESDCLFEMTGDLVLDCLIETDHGAGMSIEERLNELAEFVPPADFLPGARLHELHGRLASMRVEEKGLQVLRRYGLTVLDNLQKSGALDIDWRTVISEWSRDAGRKARSFQTSLRDVRVRNRLYSLWQEGRLQ